MHKQQTLPDVILPKIPPLVSGVICIHEVLAPPALCPNTVTEFGSPPKLEMNLFTLMYI